MKKLVLGSTSPFRKELLKKLHLPFDTDSPNIDESAIANESPEQLVKRLAEQKARALAENHPDSLIIGSDQVACIEQQILGKPGNREKAIEQLSFASGKAVVFYTGLCVLDTTSNQAEVICEPFTVTFRHLEKQQIENYLDKEEPYNCAGSFKSEGYGITLFESLKGNDPNSLIGLPLIQLVRMLAKHDIVLP